MLEFKSDKLADIHIKIVSRKRNASGFPGEGMANDVKVLCQFPAHRAILAAFSEWFAAKLIWPANQPPSTPHTQNTQGGSCSPSSHAQPMIPVSCSQCSAGTENHTQAGEKQSKPGQAKGTKVAPKNKKQRLSQVLVSSSSDADDELLPKCVQPGPSTAGSRQTPLQIVEVVTTEDESVLIELMIRHMYALVQEASKLKGAGSAADLLKPLSQLQLVKLLQWCDFYASQACAAQAASALQQQALEVGTVIELYTCAGSLAQQDHMKPLMAVAKEKLMGEFGDLEVACSDDDKSKAITELLNSNDTKVASEDTAAVLVCSWIASQSVAPSHQEVDSLMRCLRLLWLSNSFRSMIPYVRIYKPLHEYMQHPDRKPQLDFIFTWQNSQSRQVLDTARRWHAGIFENFPASSMRPHSSRSAVVLSKSIPSTQIKASADEVLNQKKSSSFCTDVQFLAGFSWQGALRVHEAGIELSLKLTPTNRFHNAQDATEAEAVLLVVKSFKLRLGRSATINRVQTINTAPLSLYKTWGWQLCSLDDWQKYVVDGELWFEVTVNGPPLL